MPESPRDRAAWSRGRGALVLVAANLVLVAAAVGAAEFWLSRRDPPAAVRYSVYPPGQVTTVRVDPRVTPGVTGDAEFEINAVGTRGPLPETDDDIRILAIGGSTTECFVLSLEESWPWRLGRHLEEGMGRKVWVGNIARAGRNSRQHYFDAAYVLPQFGRVDLALLLVGINDLFNRMIQGEVFETEDVLAREADGEIDRVLHVSGTGDSWIGRSALARRARRALEAIDLIRPRPREVNRLLSHTLPDFYVDSRAMRAARGRTIDALPPMDAPLAEFERNLSLIVERIRANGTTPVLITQPALWRAGLPPDQEALLWLGSADGWPPRREGGPYYSVEAMAAMLAMYNDALRRVARAGEVPLIDLAARVPQDVTTFYDDIHFNESGAAAVARILARDLIASGALAPVTGRREPR